MEGAFFAPKAKGRVLTMTYDTSPASPQRIELSGRESLTVSGVEDVDRFDETEIVIRVLSFGPYIKVLEPECFVNLIKERLISQKSCELK